MTDKKAIITHLNKYTPVDDDAAEGFFKFAEYKKIPKNKFFVRTGEFPSKLVFIVSGCLMTFYENEQGELTVVQFGTDMWWTGDLDGFSNKTASGQSIKAMMDTETLSFTFENFNKLCAQSPEFERFFRKIFQNSLVSHGKRILRNLSFTAEDRYKEFEKQFPYIINLVPQKYIASYLGITPEFLSKIRNKRTGKQG